MDNQRALEALEALVATVEATGGLMLVDNEWVPVADEEWLDLAVAYTLACAALRRKPMLVPEPTDEIM